MMVSLHLEPLFLCLKLQMEGRKANKALLLLLIPFSLFFHALCQSDDVQTAPMERAEQEALYSMIRGFVGPSWNSSGLYPDPCGWTPIQGVSCDLFDGLWYVTSVSIGPVLENSLQCSRSASFSPYLFELRHLKSLSFFNCFASPVALPSNYWDRLSQNLETLEFRSNRGLVGQIPPAFGQLVNLQSLVLVENSLSGQLPQELGDLARLKRLTITGNRVSGPIPSTLGKNMADLLILDLSGNSLTGHLHQSLGGLTSLLKLDISNNLLNGSLPTELGHMKSLTLLDLRNNNLSGGLASSLEEMVSLQDMLLSDNPMGGDLNGFRWEKLVNLRNVDLSNMSLVGEIPHAIEKLRSLRFLALDNNYLSGSISPRLGLLPGLNALYLNRNNFSGEISFSDEFYGRVGRRFASWGNPNLCCRAENGPLGVEKCKREVEDVFDPKNKVSRDVTGQNSSESSSGLSASCISGVFLAVLMQLISVIVLL